ncbi:hypothetical protein [Acetobacter sp. P1H12_c]|uniref:hypothetical protein n=1 Tax=Acetobacter sp. P1H12_c TaxID=2762621 RepID=UPI00207B0ED3|nr:hypothetical protein [Acetobacter sp. P1H12_c]
MSDAKFTPGPWGLDVGFDSSPGDFDKYWQVHDGHDAIACSANCYAGNREANAHLIAAAPELYEALSDLVSSLECTDTDLFILREEIKVARAALAKARGEAS